jgi:hypothetical protein
VDGSRRLAWRRLRYGDRKATQPEADIRTRTISRGSHIGTLLAALAAVHLGATAAPGIWAVAFVLGLFSTASCALALWAATQS